MHLLLPLLLTLALAPPSLLPAHVVVDAANVRRAPGGPVVGELERGDAVVVTGCLPDCTSGGGWALLGVDGAVARGAVAFGASDFAPSRAALEYGRVRDGGTAVYRAPSSGAAVVAHIPAGQDLAFRVEPDLRARGWLRRPDGGCVPAARIRPHVASDFAGIRSPSLPARLRERVVAFVRRRPGGIGGSARWVHVDLSRQLLTAYEGDRLVFATLVSTGRAHPTPTGHFRVWYKAVHAPMRGHPPDEPYFVDEVPYAMFFHGNLALHGTFWHDRFGRRMSHGCVNLSVGDAAWLFAWSPPSLPSGWRALEPAAAGRATLDVIIESKIAERDRLSFALVARGR
jgi:lipoprotein-anchoring transpeptidase ErfK/SrfK